MRRKILLFFAFAMFLFSCNKQPEDESPPNNDISDKSTQPALAHTEPSISQAESETDLPKADPPYINPIVEILFSGDSEKLAFDDIAKNISGGSMTAKLIDESIADAKISKGDDAYYPVYPNLRSDVKISPLDTFIEILEKCEYVETDALDERTLYAFVFCATDINGEKNEICVYVTRSCAKFTYNGVSDGKEYANKNICDKYKSYIGGIIPDENGQLLTIW